MLYRIGRMLQLVGLVLLPVGIAGNLLPDKPLSLWRSLSIAGVGILVFYLGRWIQKSGT